MKNKVSMWVICSVLFILSGSIDGFYLDGLDDLGDRISSSVQANLRGLDNLGERISNNVQAQVQASLPQWRNQGFSQSRVNSEFPQDDVNRPFPFGSKGGPDLGLAGLGDQIQQQVYQSLEPVRAIPLNMNMRHGVGGTTIATYQPAGRQFIIKNHELYSCDSSIDLSTRSCSGQLLPFKITESSPKTDWCYLSSYSIINDVVCLSTGPLSINAVNNHVTCSSSQGSPIIQTKLDEYKETCSKVNEYTEYRYIPDVNDPAHVEIPNKNKYVRCENNDKNLCIFRENNALLHTFVSPGSTFMVNQGSVGISNAMYI